jgi:hypothetical protein
MSREAQVRFWESAALRCAALLDYLKAYVTVAEAKREIGNWFNFYNDQRPHQTLKYHTPRQFFNAAMPVDMWTTQERALPTSPQAQQPQQSDSHNQEGLVHSIAVSRIRRADVIQPGYRALS